MKNVTLNFDVIGFYSVTLDVDDYLLEEDNWDEMTKEEQIDFILDNLEDDGYDIATRNCDFNIGSLESIDFDDGTTEYID